jgi:hypothetical protein
MKVIKLDTPFDLSAVVRIAPTSGDIIDFYSRNEASNLELDININWEYSKGRLIFEIPAITQGTMFNAGDKCEIIITNVTTGTVIYRGKLIVVKEDTDIQNYTPSTQTTQRFK